MWRRLIFCACVLTAIEGHAQTRPVLISHTDSTRAIAIDSVTRRREPFNTTAEISFSSDPATRIMLFALNLQVQPGETVSADAEDANHNFHQLTVEHVGSVPNQPWATSVVMRLPPNLPSTGDVLVRITYGGLASNRVRVGIGQVGGGPPDDMNAVPTPGPPFDPPSAITATNLTSTDVQSILQQAASAAASLGKAVTIIVTDREGNILGSFAMTGAPAATTIRSIGTLGQGLEGAVAPAVEAATAKAATAAFFSTTGNAFPRARRASSSRNTFHPASVFARVDRSTACSSLLFLAATSRNRQRGLAFLPIPAVCRFTKTDFPPAASASKATVFTRSIAIQPTTISLSKK